ncbi:MAG: GEVED domain-containing protein, partial [Planctomycetia bacterium]|nr:GEVED domain-containing protein [Planctomycetia bacterium]
GDTFTLSDGVNTLTFQFLDAELVSQDTGVVTDGVAIYINRYGSSFTARDVAAAVVSAINTSTVYRTLQVTASVCGRGNLVTLYGANDVGGDFFAKSGQDLTSLELDPKTYLVIGSTYSLGDRKGISNLETAQGMTLIANNEIYHSENYGIQVAPGNAADGVAWLIENNPYGLIPGLVIENNVIAYSGTGGISITGEGGSSTNNDSQGTAPLARILNNTIYGNSSRQGTGVALTNAAATLMNNVFANLTTAISVSGSVPTSQTVMGRSVFQNTDVTSTSSWSAGSQSIILGSGDALFVSPENLNFYPKSGSQIIDASLDSLDDRTIMRTLRDALGIPASPIEAPDYDAYGRLRVDDPTVANATGLGGNPLKDVGALERSDFVGPIVQLTVPQDEMVVVPITEYETRDMDPDEYSCSWMGVQLTEFRVELTDLGNSEIADSTKRHSDNVKMIAMDPATGEYRLLTENEDYLFEYVISNTGREIVLTPTSGTWATETVYYICLSSAITDRAENALEANEIWNGLPAEAKSLTGCDSALAVRISLPGKDYGDAPESFATQSGGTTIDAYHLVQPGFHLGADVSTESGTRGVDADTYDDGLISVNTSVTEAGVRDAIDINNGAINEIVVSVSVPSSFSQSLTPVLYVWIDLNNDGTWSEDERVVSGSVVQNGLNTLTFTIPEDADLTTEGSDVYARFRLTAVSSTESAALNPTGLAMYGEVEDYRVSLAKDSG